MTYITKASHYKEALAHPAAPEAAKQLAKFFDAVVESAKITPLEETLPSDVPCMAGPRPHRWCLGVMDVFWGDSPLRIHWECPLCGKRGIVTEADAVPLKLRPPGSTERLH